jgi:peptide/nickel transport system substrate-binding protein
MKATIALLACVVFLAACARTGSENAIVDGRHVWSVPHVLRFADIQDPDHLNPYLSTMDVTYDLSSMIYSYLIVADDRGRLIGDLATAVPTLRNGGISKDGTTYRYHLHRGVKWHDGAPFTSADVKFSWQAVVNPRNNTLHREGYDQVASIDTPDRYTVVVHLKRRYPPFVTKFFTPLQEGGKGLLPRHLLAKYDSINQVPFNSAPVGTGPFKFVKWDRGRQIVLDRNDAYFKGRPKFEKIVFSIIPDDNTMLNELRLHHLDLITSPPNPFYEQYKTIPGIVVDTAPWNGQSLFLINNSHPGLREVRVRRAIAMGIDYDAIIKKLTHGVGERAYDVIPPTAIGYTKNPPYRYDPAQANRMLDADGWTTGPDGVRAKDGIRMDYVMDFISGSANQRAISLQIQAYMHALGIRLSLKPYAYNAIFVPTGPVYGGSYDFVNYSDTLNWDPDELFYLGCHYFYPKGENVYRYCNPQVDALEKAGLATDDPAKRAAIYHKAELLIHDTVPYIPLYETRRLIVRSPDIKNFSVNPTSTPWWNIWQWDI